MERHIEVVFRVRPVHGAAGSVGEAALERKKHDTTNRKLFAEEKPEETDVAHHGVQAKVLTRFCAKTLVETDNNLRHTPKNTISCLLLLMKPFPDSL